METIIQHQAKAEQSSSSEQQDILNLLNKFYAERGVTSKISIDPLQHLQGLSDEIIQDHMTKVLGLMRLSPDQKPTVQTTRKLPAGILAILGHAGCVKTTTLALITVFSCRAASKC